MVPISKSELIYIKVGAKEVILPNSEKNGKKCVICTAVHSVRGALELIILRSPAIDQTLLYLCVTIRKKLKFPKKFLTKFKFRKYFFSTNCFDLKLNRKLEKNFKKQFFLEIVLSCFVDGLLRTKLIC